MASTESARDAAAVRRGWKLTLLLFAAIAFVVVAWPTFQSSSDHCDLCCSLSQLERVTSFGGLVQWTDDRVIQESAVVTDGIAGASHRHVWSMRTRSTRGVFSRTIACGRAGEKTRRVTSVYAYDPDFRADVQASVARGELTIDQLRREVEGPLPDSDPGRAVLDELLARRERRADERTK